MNTIIIKEILCPKCNGSGRVYDHAFGILTGGLGYLFQAFDNEDKQLCPKCNGKGKIALKETRYEE